MKWKVNASKKMTDLINLDYDDLAWRGQVDLVLVRYRRSYLLDDYVSLQVGMCSNERSNCILQVVSAVFNSNAFLHHFSSLTEG